MASKLVWALAKKSAWNMLPFTGSEPTKRVEPAAASQTFRWFRAPDVVFVDPVSKSSISVGSGYNAAYVQRDAYDMVINCCPDELSVTHPVVRNVELRDTNYATLDLDTMETLAAEVKQVLDLPDKRVLVHCWVGASRSVAVAAFIVCRLYPVAPCEAALLAAADAKDECKAECKAECKDEEDKREKGKEDGEFKVEEGKVESEGNVDKREQEVAESASWNHYYAAFKRARPSISVSTRLKAQVLQLLAKTAGTEVRTVDRVLPIAGITGAGGALSSGVASAAEKATEKAVEKASEKVTEKATTTTVVARPPPPPPPLSSSSSSSSASSSLNAFDYSSDDFDSDSDFDSEAEEDGDALTNAGSDQKLSGRPTYVDVTKKGPSNAAAPAAGACVPSWGARVFHDAKTVVACGK